MREHSSFDRATFMANFQGMEDLAQETIKSFLSIVPDLLLACERALQKKDMSEIERLAHTLKGALSNFYAEPSMDLAFKLEKMGHEKSINGADKVFVELKNAVAMLFGDLNALLIERNAG